MYINQTPAVHVSDNLPRLRHGECDDFERLLNIQLAQRADLEERQSQLRRQRLHTTTAPQYTATWR